MSDAVRIAVSVVVAVVLAAAGVLVAGAFGLEERWLVGGVAGATGGLVGAILTGRKWVANSATAYRFPQIMR